MIHNNIAYDGLMIEDGCGGKWVYYNLKAKKLVITHRCSRYKIEAKIGHYVPNDGNINTAGSCIGCGKQHTDFDKLTFLLEPKNYSNE